MRRAAGWAGKGLLLLALVAYQYLVHMGVSSTEAGPGLRYALILLPLLAFAFWVVARSRHKALWLGALLATGALAWLLERRDSVGLVAFNGISHAAACLFLLWYFGRTLAGGAEPLITRFARRVHGTLSSGLEAYTRKLTAAWCVFFAAQLLVSASLYLFAPLDAWSIFVNLLNLPLVLLMFIGEWAYRVTRHPEHPRVSIGQAVRAFISDSAYPNRNEAR
jgi:uncharacterized membrane protein